MTPGDKTGWTTVNIKKRVGIAISFLLFFLILSRAESGSHACAASTAERHLGRKQLKSPAEQRFYNSSSERRRLAKSKTRNRKKRNRRYHSTKYTSTLFFFFYAESRFTVAIPFLAPPPFPSPFPAERARIDENQYTHCIRIHTRQKPERATNGNKHSTLRAGINRYG